MSPKAEAIYQAALELPEGERMDLADVLRHSVVGSPVPPLSEAWRAEIERRSVEIDAGTMKFVTLKESERRIAEIIRQAEEGERA